MATVLGVSGAGMVATWTTLLSSTEPCMSYDFVQTQKSYEHVHDRGAQRGGKAAMLWYVCWEERRPSAGEAAWSAANRASEQPSGSDLTTPIGGAPAMGSTDVQQRPGEVATWDPFEDLEHFREQFAQVFPGWPRVPDWRRAGNGLDVEFIPLADVEETDDAYVVEMELPGVNKDDINIELSGRRLTVTGERMQKERHGALRRRTVWWDVSATGSCCRAVSTTKRSTLTSRRAC